MALEISLTDGGGERDMVTVDRHWYLTEDQGRVVPEGDPASRWLWATPGMEVSRVDAERLGAVQARADEPGEAPAVKAASKPGDKARDRPGDKSVTVAELRERATELGIQVDNRWGAERLQQEIASAGEG